MLLLRCCSAPRFSNCYLPYEHTIGSDQALHGCHKQLAGGSLDAGTLQPISLRARVDPPTRQALEGRACHYH